MIPIIIRDGRRAAARLLFYGLGMSLRSAQAELFIVRRVSVVVAVAVFG